MNDIFDEILNDQNEEKKVKFVKKLLPTTLVLTIISVIVLASYNFYSNKKISHNREVSDLLFKTLYSDNSDSDLVLKSLNTIQLNSNNRIRELALIQKAEILYQMNNFTESKKILELIIQDTYFHELTKAYARLLWLCQIINNSETSEEDTRNTHEYLSYFSEDTRPFYGTASLIRASWYIKHDQEESALQLLSKLATSTSSSATVKDQAKTLILNIENKKVLK